MSLRKLGLLGGAAVVMAFLASPASALTMQECSAKYNAAKDAGTLGGQNWNAFRKAQCGTDAPAAEAPAKKSTTKAKADTKPAADTADQASGLTMQQCSTKYNAAKDADALNGMNWNAFRKAECGPGASTSVSAPAKAAKSKAQPAATDTASEGSGLSMKECSAKYQAAKDANTLNGMNWNAFRKAQCAAGASAAAPAAEPAAASADDSGGGLSMKECSAKYQAAKAADTLNGKNWNTFRKEDCAAGASAAVAPATAAAATASSGGGLSMKECSAKYQAAKADGSVGSLKWNDFRKQRCGAGANDDDDAPSIDEANYNSEPERAATRAPSGVSFPNAVSTKFRNETPAKQRMHTCLESYYENKDANTLNGLRWIQKGGGFYSLCNSRLKGES